MGRVMHTTSVVEILLADGWHRVAEGSFVLETFEVVDRGGRVSLLLEPPGHGFPNEAACWSEPSGVTMICPLSSVVALKLARDTTEK